VAAPAEHHPVLVQPSYPSTLSSAGLSRLGIFINILHDGEDSEIAHWDDICGDKLASLRRTAQSLDRRSGRLYAAAHPW